MWERLWENLVDGACAGGEEAEAFDVLVPFHFPSQAGQPAGNTLSARKSSRALAMRYPVLAQAVPLLASQPPEERGRSEAGDSSLAIADWTRRSRRQHRQKQHTSHCCTPTRRRHTERRALPGPASAQAQTAQYVLGCRAR
eukprot:2213248-Rhodomonas_salina.3